MTNEQETTLKNIFREAVEHYAIEGGIAAKLAHENAVAHFYTDGPFIAAILGQPPVKAAEVLEWAREQKKERK